MMFVAGAGRYSTHRWQLDSPFMGHQLRVAALVIRISDFKTRHSPPGSPLPQPLPTTLPEQCLCERSG
jgi:hypothetical protein